MSLVAQLIRGGRARARVEAARDARHLLDRAPANAAHIPRPRDGMLLLRLLLAEEAIIIIAFASGPWRRT